MVCYIISAKHYTKFPWRIGRQVSKTKMVAYRKVDLLLSGRIFQQLPSVYPQRFSPLKLHVTLTVSVSVRKY